MAQEAILITSSSSESDVEDTSSSHPRRVQVNARDNKQFAPIGECRGLRSDRSTATAACRLPADESPLTIDDSADDSTEPEGGRESDEPAVSSEPDTSIPCQRGAIAPVLANAAAVAADSSSDESDDGDFYTKSVSNTFAKRSLCTAALVKVPPPEKKARCANSSDSSSPAASRGRAGSLDESEEEKEARNHSMVRTPSPPPKLEPKCTKRRRPKFVTNALSVLERYKVDSKETVAESCEAASPLDTKKRQRTVFLLVRLRSSTEKFRISTDETLASIITKLADKEGISPRRVLLYFNDMQVTRDDTPASLGLKAGDALDCVILPHESDPQLTSIACASEDMVQLKVQDCCGQRSRVVMSVSRREPLKSLMVEFAQRKGVCVESLAFHFDGEELSATATCEDVGLEDDFCIDVTAK